MKTIGVAFIFLLFGFTAPAQLTTRPVPALDLKDIHGRAIRLGDYKGRVVLLNFWATWCLPCRTEIPDLIKLQTNYRNQGLRIIGITYPPEKMDEVLRFARKVGINYRVALGTKDTKSLLTSSETLPITVIIDSEGAIHDVIEGIMYPDEFDQKVKPLLGTAKKTQALPPSGSKKESRLGKATIVVNAEGYQPSSISLRRGVRAQLTFIRKVEESCGQDIVIPAYGIKRPLPLNTPVTVVFTPHRTGRFKFTCGMDMFRGTLLVK